MKKTSGIIVLVAVVAFILGGLFKQMEPKNPVEEQVEPKNPGKVHLTFSDGSTEEVPPSEIMTVEFTTYEGPDSLRLIITCNLKEGRQGKCYGGSEPLSEYIHGERASCTPCTPDLPILNESRSDLIEIPVNRTTIKRKYNRTRFYYDGSIEIKEMEQYVPITATYSDGSVDSSYPFI